MQTWIYDNSLGIFARLRIDQTEDSTVWGEWGGVPGPTKMLSTISSLPIQLSYLSLSLSSHNQSTDQPHISDNHNSTTTTTAPYWGFCLSGNQSEMSQPGWRKRPPAILVTAAGYRHLRHSPGEHHVTPLHAAIRRHCRVWHDICGFVLYTRRRNSRQRAQSASGPDWSRRGRRRLRLCDVTVAARSTGCRRLRSVSDDVRRAAGALCQVAALS